MRKNTIATACALSLCLAACSSLMKSPDARRPASAPSVYMTTLTSLDQFRDMAISGDGLVKGGKSLKFLIDWKTDTVYFINSNYQENGQTPDFVKYHYFFARHVLNVTDPYEVFNRQTYFTKDISQREYTAGTLQLYDLQSAAQSHQQILGLQFYPQDLINEEGILKVARLVGRSIEIPVPKAFVSYGDQQTVQSVRTQLREAGFQIFSVSDILGSVQFIPMNTGEAWGYPRIFPRDLESLSPTDIPVFKDLPLDLSVVAGVITVTLQDPGSHISLKSKERGTPDMVIRDPQILSRLKTYEKEGTPIHYVVRNDSFLLEPTTKKEVEAHYKAHLPKKWYTLPAPQAAEITTYDQMCPQSPAGCLEAAQSFGGKAAKLGFLAHKSIAGVGSSLQKKLGYRLTPYGAGIPLAHYREFVEANPELKEKINELVLREQSDHPLSSREKEEKSAEIHRLFYKAHFPPGQLEKVQAVVDQLKSTIERENPGIQLKKLKIRSSANVEDMPGFDGAGLHDSFGAKLKEESSPNQSCRLKVSQDDESDDEGVSTKMDMDPPSLACAIKGVYASLWNKRAIEERSFRHLDHATALMGIAIVPSYNYLAKLKNKKAPDNHMEESANSVLVTRVLGSSATYGYTLSTQQAPNLVTNPIPGTLSEVEVVAFLENETPSFTLTQAAVPKAGSPPLSGPILPADKRIQVIDIGRQIEISYCQYQKSYYTSAPCAYVISDTTKPKALDMEFKFLGTGNRMRILLKQMREFAGH